MKNLILIVICCTSFAMFSQDLTMDCEFEKSGINFFYQKISSSVFKVSSEGKLMEVLLFENEEEASGFMRSPREIFKPQNSFEIKGIRIVTDSYTGIEYYGSNRYHTGKIKRIGNVFIDYYGPNRFNSGEIKRIGDVFIEYYGPNRYHTGKIKQIGNVFIGYIGPNRYNSRKIRRIGDVFINYIGPNRYDTGKIEQIGKTRIYYYSPRENNSGRLKAIRGEDDRIKLISRYSGTLRK